MALTQRQINQINACGATVFINPKNLNRTGIERKDIVSGNTLRGFHREDTKETRPSILLDKFHDTHYIDLVNDIKFINSETELKETANKYRKLLIGLLKKHIKAIKSEEKKDKYNKTRKIIDLYFEFIVACDYRITNSERKRLLPLLNIPLDGWILQNIDLFNNEERVRLEIPKNATMSSIVEEAKYIQIQEFLKAKSEMLHIDHTIYLDLLWSNVYERTNKNNLCELKNN